MHRWMERLFSEYARLTKSSVQSTHQEAATNPQLQATTTPQNRNGANRENAANINSNTHISHTHDSVNMPDIVPDNRASEVSSNQNHGLVKNLSNDDRSEDRIGATGYRHMEIMWTERDVWEAVGNNHGHAYGLNTRVQYGT
jgi:hypothetical protein